MFMLGAQKSSPSRGSRRPARTAMLYFARPSVPMASRHLMDQGRVKGSSEADGLGKHGGDAWPGNAVQSFAPPIVGGNLQAGNFAGLVDELRYFLFQGHPGKRGR